MSLANIDAMVREAKRAIRAGNKAEAQKLLLKATELDQSNEQAWMWLSAVVDTVEDQIICLENVLQINPNNADAKRGLEMLRKKAPPPVEKPPSKPNNPFLMDAIDWDIDADTDFLMDTLKPKSSKPNTTPTSSARDLLDDADDPINPPTDPFISVFESTDVFATDLDDEPSPVSTNSPSPTISSQTSDDLSSLDEEIFGDQAQKVIDDFLALDDDFLTDKPQPLSKSVQKAPPKQQQTTQQKASTKSTKSESDIFDIDQDADPAIYFEMIPANIKPTRIPGIDETYPPLLIPSIIGLVLLNIGALVWLIL